jgi:hypothetical protein
MLKGVGGESNMFAGAEEGINGEWENEVKVKKL